MGQSTEELSQDIAQTRQRLTADVDALEDKVSPTAIVERRKAAARSRVGQVRDRVLGSAQSAGQSVGDRTPDAGELADRAGDTAEHAKQAAQERYDGAPAAAGLVAFGAGLVLAALLPASRVEARTGSALADQVKEKAQPVVEDAKQAAAQVGQEVKESATSAAQDLKDSAADSAATVREEGKSAAEDVRSDASSGSGPSGGTGHDAGPGTPASPVR